MAEFFPIAVFPVTIILTAKCIFPMIRSLSIQEDDSTSHLAAGRVVWSSCEAFSLMSLPALVNQSFAGSVFPVVRSHQPSHNSETKDSD